DQHVMRAQAQDAVFGRLPGRSFADGGLRLLLDGGGGRPQAEAALIPLDAVGGEEILLAQHAQTADGVVVNLVVDDLGAVAVDIDAVLAVLVDLAVGDEDVGAVRIDAGAADTGIVLIAFAVAGAVAVDFQADEGEMLAGALGFAALEIFLLGAGIDADAGARGACDLKRPHELQPAGRF